MEVQEQNSRDWCAIWGTILTSFLLTCMGFALAVNKVDTATGYTLTVIGGILLLLSIMAALGKSRMKSDQPMLYDRPPSYRWSWRRSFMRRHPSSRITGDRLVPSGMAERSSGVINPATDTLSERAMNGSHTISATTWERPFPMCTMTRSSNSLMEEGRIGVGLARHSHSLSSVLDPPSYEAAVANMDEGTLRKLKSEFDIRVSSCGRGSRQFQNLGTSEP